MGLFGKKTKDHVVDVMLSMAIHPSNILLEGPANIRNWSERTLRDNKPKWKLAPDAKTGFIMAPGRSMDQVKNDLPEQMQKFMRMNGFDPRQYNTDSFTVHLDREDIKYVSMTASRKPQDVRASESTQRPTLSDEELDSFQYPADLIPPLAGYCSDPQCPCSETEIPKGSGWLFISQDAVTFLKAAKQDPSLLNSSGMPVPLLICEKAATLRRLDLSVSSTDAKRWWKTGRVPLRATPLATPQDTTQKSQISQAIREQLPKLKADIELQLKVLSHLFNCCQGGEFNRQHVENYFEMDRKTASGYTDEVRNKLLNAENYFPTKGYEQARFILIETHSSLIQKFIKLYGDMLPVLPPDEAKTHIPFLEEVSSKMSKL